MFSVDNKWLLAWNFAITSELPEYLYLALVDLHITGSDYVFSIFGYYTKV